MLGRGVRGRLAPAVGCVAVALAFPAAAGAASLVFVKDGNVWIAGADGSGARAVTSQPNNWAWPSEADDGTILVAGGAQRVNADGSDSDGSSELYLLDQQGRTVGGPATTPASTSTPQCPTYAPQIARVSPNGASVAYSLFFCDGFRTFYGPALGGTAGVQQSLADYVDPSWIDDGRFLITHQGTTLDAAQAQWGVWDTGARTAGAWRAGESYLTGYQAVVSRTGTRVAVLQDDGADHYGTVATAKISIYAASGIQAADTALRCEIPLDAATLQNAQSASPSLSPDGSTIVWAQSDGIHTAATDCTGARLLIPGGRWPFFGKADATAAAGGGTPSPGTPAPGSTGVQTADPLGTKVKTKASIVLGVKHAVARHRVKLTVRVRRATGVKIVRYRWSFGDRTKAVTTHAGKATHVFRRAGRYTVRLTVKDSTGATATTKLRVTVRRR
jgi:hypothetical protein